MPDRDGNAAADDATPVTSLHGYKEGRKEDIKGDADKLESENPDPQSQQVSELEGEGELDLPHDKH